MHIDRKRFRDQVMGCWLGKNAGGTLGEPLEEKFGRKEMFHVDWYPFLPEGGIPNDDLELQLIWFQQLQKKGPGLTAADLTEAWTDCVAYNFDEYGLSKENMQKGLMPPVCGWHNNAFRDCMGSPIRSEIWACVAPGCPEIAAWYAFQDAVVDHGGGESVYGEIFNAVLESCAFVNGDKFVLLEAALSSIPSSCVTYQCVKRSMDNYHAGMGYEENRNDLVKTFYHPVAQYSPLNLGFQTIGWLYGEDFGDAICKAVNCGWDTDCTAATLGAILGIIGGASSLPEKWTAPLGYEIATNMTTGGIRNLTAPTDIRELTEAVCQEAERVLRYWGKEILFSDGGIAEADGTMEEEERPAVPKLKFLEEYAADSLVYFMGGMKETVRYESDAAILGNRISKIQVILENLHPVEKEIRAVLEVPEGFLAAPPEKQNLRLGPKESMEIEYEIQAKPEQIRESNLCWLNMQIKNEPAVPAIPIVLLGGNRWMISQFYPNQTIEDDCGLDEHAWFVHPPEGFTEQWHAGNDLEMGNYFSQKGVVYALHQLYSEEEKDVVLGVPNNGFMKLYLNGEWIHTTIHKTALRANLGNGGALGDLSNYKVTKLRKGWNQILIKLQADELPAEAHFTIGGMSHVCEKNHGMPVLGLCRSRFLWEI